MRVAVRALHLKHAFAEFEDGDIEGAAAQVVDGDLLIFLLLTKIP
jgi:hypothetical protein